MNFIEYVLLYYALIAATFVLAGVLAALYLAVESFGVEVPRCGDE